MGFWELQVNDLMTGIGGLGGLPMNTPTPSPPLPPPLPAKSLPTADVPQYPPFIPERDMDLGHLPQDAIAATHDDGGVILKKPGELGPSSYPGGPRYVEAPEGSGVWIPDHRPYPPGSPHPASWSGKGAQEADQGDAALRRTRQALNDADQGLARSITDAHTADAHTKTQLQRIRQEIHSGVTAMQPTLGTAAGREQLAAFLDRKASEAKQVASDAREVSMRVSSAFEAVGRQFDAARDA